jgi:hypothetical protein
MIGIASKVFLAFGGLLIVVGIVWLIVAAIASLRKQPPKPRVGPAAGGPFAGLPLW